ncbi:MAG: hypothetical protein ACLGH3_03135 [Actinomycetota bacterium]
MRKRLIGAVLVLGMVGAACSSTSPQTQEPAPSASKTDSAPSSPAMSGSADLRTTLTLLLDGHEYLAGIAIFNAVNLGMDNPLTEAAVGALDENSVQLSEAIASVYGQEAGDAFLPLWRKHIGFFVDYTLGKAGGDNAKAAKARKDLDGYRADFGAFLASANPNLTKDAVAKALVPHVQATFTAIDAVVAKKPGQFALLSKGASHMVGIAEVLSDAISRQFPEKFSGDATGSASGLRATLTHGLVEHEYLAGIAVYAAVNLGMDSKITGGAVDALDGNSVALSQAIASVYGKEAGDAFLPLWRKHIGFFVDYTLAKAGGDEAKAQKAANDLDGYRADFGAFLASANPNLTKDAVADVLVRHVESTFAAIDAVVAKDASAFSKLREAAQHMDHIAAVLADAIAKQFPKKFA